MHPFCCYSSSENIIAIVYRPQEKNANNIKCALDFYYNSQFYMVTFQTGTHGAHATFNANLSFRCIY